MPKLLKCEEYKEVFEIVGGNKHWIQNPETFNYLLYKWNDVEVISFEELRDKYLVGSTRMLKTVPAIGIGKEPHGRFYPDDQAEVPNPYRWMRGLLTLKPMPSAKLATDLGFNLMVPFANIPSGWTGKVAYTSTHVRSDKRCVGYWPSDEPGCHKHDPYADLETVKDMKKQTDLPVGLALVSDFGCGTTMGGYTKEEYHEAWIKVSNQVDWLRLTTYPYRRPPHDWWGNPMETMEFFHKLWSERITVPIVPVIQAHMTYKLVEPKVMEQVKFWVERGYGYIVYPWSNPNLEVRGVVDMQEEWKEANLWAEKEVR